jgi:hypothetical protein
MAHRNLAAELSARALQGAEELQSLSDQIVTPNGPGSTKRRLADLAFAVRWLVEDHAVMSALADSLHEELTRLKSSAPKE